MLSNSHTILFSVVLILTICCVQMEPVKVGGTGTVKAVKNDPEVINMVQIVKPLYEKKMNRSHNDFTPLEYRTQLVSGLNFFVKVRVGPNQCVHLRIYRAFDRPPVLHGVLLDKKESDPLEYFDQNL